MANMHQYVRLMRRPGANTSSDDERSQIIELLKSAPGVERIKIVERHPRGGYSVTFDRSNESVDDFILMFEQHDWMAGM